MSFFDDASLVMIPSGYKDQKVYSVKPTDGTGDLTFSRASSATRVQSNGLIEKVRTNLILQSEAFNSASWNTTRATITANATTAPNGTATADLFTDGTFTSTNCFSDQLVLTSGTYNMSGFVKAGTSPFIALILYDTQDNGVLFNTSTQAITTFGTVTDQKVESYGNGWYRISFSRTVNSANSFAGISVRPTNSIGPYNGTGSLTAFFWGVQVETGDIATDYIATTTAAVSVGPVSGLPRLDYLGSTCPRLLLEPQRTNTQINSENFAAWLGSDNITIGSNTSDTLDPAGFNGADKITLLGGAPMRVYEFTGSTAGTGTISLFAKAGTSTNIALFTSSGTLLVGFNLTTQVVTPSAGTGTITNYGNGWYRITATSTLGASEVLQITFVGSNGQTIYIYGAQVEAGAYATSYIPTLGASVTRVADAAIKTGITSLIGQTEGTLFAEVQRLNVGVSAVVLQFNDGTNNNRVQIEIGSGGQTFAICSNAGATTCLITGPTLTLGQTYKIAFSYKVNDFKLFVDGVSGGVDTSGAVPVSMSRLDLASEAGISYAGYALAQALHFKTALTSTQLAELTA
jgi:hypothetical protein